MTRSLWNPKGVSDRLYAPLARDPGGEIVRVGEEVGRP